MRYANLERLATRGHMLRMPHSRSLGDGLYELRFTCESVSRRITYSFDADRSAVTLTTFRKQRQNERAEVLRARRAQAARRDGGRAKKEGKGR
ncbi:type II toxin-antitoxin system RelE/ParE family toxin [Kineosphaera limosa]|uniref:type II toxin-antitoxin system RelE/ParE family toxin n=1 Tax=Kineosphaera limosa TaxID=111564 RepID=UPI0020D19D8E|nr:type II toxin-antitoxin system RelE/ParE family toxin [Kineosphaera limosa]